MQSFLKETRCSGKMMSRRLHSVGHHDFDAASRQAFRRRFRTAGIGLVFARKPGGEARTVGIVEAKAMIDRYDNLVERTIRLRRRGMIVSAVVAPLLLFLSAVFQAWPLSFVGWLALVSFPVVFSWTIVMRGLGRKAEWNRLANRPAAPALSRRDKIEQGYALALRDWLWIVPLALMIGALEIKSSALVLLFGPGAADIQAIGRSVIFPLGGLLLCAGLVMRVGAKIWRR